MSAPLPTEVMPRIRPRKKPMPMAVTFVLRVCSIACFSRATSLGMNSARPRIVSETMSSAIAIAMSSVGSKLLP